MKKIAAALAVLVFASPARAAWGSAKADFDASAEEAAFAAATQLFTETGRDKLAVVQFLESFISQFPKSPRVLDAEFMVGEATSSTPSPSSRRRPRRREPPRRACWRRKIRPP